MKRFLRRIEHFIFPRVCPHCNQLLSVDSAHLCSLCVDTIDIASVVISTPFFDGGLELCDTLSPLYSQMRLLRQHACPYIARLLASYIVYSLCSSPLPLPDWILPLPAITESGFYKSSKEGLLIGRQVAKMLPSSFGSFSERRLSKVLPGQIVCVLEEERRDEQHLAAYAQALRPLEPKQIYYISLFI